jgi:site-specific DNA recombinase
MAATSSAHIYCRVSSQGQEDGYSLATQETACRSWCAERGLAVASVAREVWSGGDRHRPELDAMLDRLTPGDVLLAYDLDRLSRGGQVDTAVIVDRIESAGASVAFVTTDFEQSETGALIRNVRAFAAALEREKIKERTQRGTRARIASGKPLVGSKPPFGYRWADAEKSKLALDPETAPVTRMMFDWALAGAPLRTIISRLAERGIPSPTGLAHWTPAVIRDLLLRPIYTGHQEAFSEHVVRGSDGKERRSRRSSEERIIVPDVAPPIITAQERAAVMSRLTHNQATATRNNRNPTATLLRCGFARCGHCGRSLSVSNPAWTRPTNSPVYRCDPRDAGVRGCPRPSIAASVLDPAVWQGVCEVLRNPTIIARAVAEHRTDGGLERELAAMEKRLQTVVSKQQRIAKAITALDDEDAVAPLLMELQNLATSKTATERECDLIRQRIADADAEEAKVRTLSEWCQTVAANLESLTYDERRMALDVLGVQVHVHRSGSVDAQGNPLPRWVITGDPAILEADILYGST